MKIIIFIGILLFINTNVFSQQNLYSHKYDFDTIYYGDTKEINLKFVNIYNKKINIEGVTGNLALVSSWDSKKIMSGDTALIKVKYIADEIGNYSSRLYISLNHQKLQSQIFYIKGVVIPRKTNVLIEPMINEDIKANLLTNTVDTISLDFGTLKFGQFKTISIKFTNIGDSPLYIDYDNDKYFPRPFIIFNCDKPGFDNYLKNDILTKTDTALIWRSPSYSVFKSCDSVTKKIIKNNFFYLNILAINLRGNTGKYCEIRQLESNTYKKHFLKIAVNFIDESTKNNVIFIDDNKVIYKTSFINGKMIRVEEINGTKSKIYLFDNK